MDTLIKNAVILTMDNGKTIDKGYILISDTKICAVGEGEYYSIADTIIDAKGKIAMPGIINTHTHSAMTLFRGYAGGHNLNDWLTKYIFPIEDTMKPDDFYWGNQLAAAEMISSGTACCVDMYFGMQAMADTVLQSGMRANMARCVQWFGEDNNFEYDTRLKEAVALYKDYHNAADGRIKVDIAPHSVYLTNPAYLQKAHEIAREYDLCYHIHLSETIKENEDCMVRFGKSPTEYLDSIGVLDNKTIAAHCVHLSDDDMQILSGRGVSVAHNPASNLKLASGIAKTWDMRKRGINVAIGTDGVSSNNNLDMFSEMYLAALLPNGVMLDAQASSTQAVLEMATINGAKATGRIGQTGMLKKGMAADVILINTDRPHMMPMHSPQENIVYAANGADVYMNMVDGKVLYKNGEFLTLDIEKIRYGVGKSIDRLFK